MSDTTRRMALTCEVREVGDGDGRTLTFVASTEDVARDGDIIKVDGWETAQFEKNPVFLWAHDPSTPPIGRVTSLRKMKAPPRLEADVQFAGEEEGHGLAETVYRLYRRGFLKAVSVGFRIRGHEVPDDDSRSELGLPPGGWIITHAELMELSAVPVPADPGALKVGEDERAAIREDLVRMRAAMPEDERDTVDGLISYTVTPEPTLSVTSTINPEMFERVFDRLDSIDEQVRELRDDLALRGALRHAAAAEAAHRDEPGDGLYRLRVWLDGHLAAKRKEPN